VIVFHSAAKELLRNEPDVPFPIIPDPTRSCTRSYRRTADDVRAAQTMLEDASNLRNRDVLYTMRRNPGCRHDVRTGHLPHRLPGGSRFLPEEYGRIEYGGLPVNSPCSLSHCAPTYFVARSYADNSAIRTAF
jgi:hypothetical protein